ncbi:hypothetical protein KC19_9G158900 [Ceratodon purpureus]|uniref:Uncharacterized protein n=1 Tax=Ceratodon purpureus TaxID=3225 RepID=A0A8T0GXX7_CERPU|nr:hypothetical protein KC19_9G158900 [Ceratodon purpureus]
MQIMKSKRRQESRINHAETHTSVIFFGRRRGVSRIARPYSEALEKLDEVWYTSPSPTPMSSRPMVPTPTRRLSNHHNTRYTPPNPQLHYPLHAIFLNQQLHHTQQVNYDGDGEMDSVRCHIIEWPPH